MAVTRGIDPLNLDVLGIRLVLVKTRFCSAERAPPTVPQLVLRAINSSRSAFVSVTFYADFFDAYDMEAASLVQAGVLMKVPHSCTFQISLLQSPNCKA